MLIAGDVGGTKTNLGAYEVQHGKLVQTAYTRFSSHVFRPAEDLVRKFVSMLSGPVTAACFGVAGPVVDNRVHATNLPWIFDGQSMAQLLKIPQVRLLNDLEATAYGISVLEPSELEVIHSGSTPTAASKAVIAAGTGLGEGILFLGWHALRRDGHRRRPRRLCAAYRKRSGALEIPERAQRYCELRNHSVGAGLPPVARILRSRQCIIRSSIIPTRIPRRSSPRMRSIILVLRASPQWICGLRFMVPRRGTLRCGRCREAGCTSPEESR